MSPGTWDAMGYPARSGRLIRDKSPYMVLAGVLDLLATSPETAKLVKGA